MKKVIFLILFVALWVVFCLAYGNAFHLSAPANAAISFIAFISAACLAIKTLIA